MKRRMLTGACAALLLLASGCGNRINGLINDAQKAAQNAQSQLEQSLGIQPEQEQTDLQAINAYPQSLTLNAGEESSLELVFTPSNTEQTAVLWVSSNPTVATVSSNGVVSAVSAGACTITAASKTDGAVSCDVHLTVTGSASNAAAGTGYAGSAEDVIRIVEETDPAVVYPGFYLSDQDVERMDMDELQFTINQIYAKNGYIFSTDSIQRYFSAMSWYGAKTEEAGHLTLSAMDQANLSRLTARRAALKRAGGQADGIGTLWSYAYTSRALEASDLQGLSAYDIQLLINTIYAKNGYLFETDGLQALFAAQPWYHGVTADAGRIAFSKLDRANLALLANARD